MLWPRALERLADLPGVERPGERLEASLHGDGPGSEVPLRAELHRVYLAEVEVVEAQHHRVGGEQLEAGLLIKRQRLHAAQLGTVHVQRVDVVVDGIQSVVDELEQRIHQLAQARGVAPLRPELLRLVVASHRVPKHDAFAVHRVITMVVLEFVTQVIDALADRLAERFSGGGYDRGGRCDGRWLAQRCRGQQQRQDGNEDAEGVGGRHRQWLLDILSRRRTPGSPRATVSVQSWRSGRSHPRR